MKDQTARQMIEQLHALYVALSGQDIPLNMDRERVWFDWVKAGFSADDLRIVVRGIRNGIKEGKRNHGALKFSNLIGMADHFEEDLALFKSAARASRPSREDRAASPRTFTQAGAQTAAPVSERALEILRKCRENLTTKNTEP
jgi:hypothetical protein